MWKLFYVLIAFRYIDLEYWYFVNDAMYDKCVSALKC